METRNPIQYKSAFIVEYFVVDFLCISRCPLVGDRSHQLLDIIDRWFAGSTSLCISTFPIPSEMMSATTINVCQTHQLIL